MHSGVVVAVTAEALDRLAAVRKFVDWQEKTALGVRLSLGTLRLRVLDALAEDAGAGIVQACLDTFDGNDGRLFELGRLCGLEWRHMRFDPRKNTLFDARDNIAADFRLLVPAPAPTVHFGLEGCYTPDMHVDITPENEPAVRRFLAALGCSQGDIDKIVASGVMRVEAKCHCRWLVFWETEAAWTLKVARLLEEQHRAPLLIVCFSEHSFTTSLFTDPSDHTSFLRVVGRGRCCARDGRCSEPWTR